MKRPALRVTKWLGDIPIEGRSTLCPDSLFTVASTHHRQSQLNTPNCSNVHLTVTTRTATGARVKLVFIFQV